MGEYLKTPLRVPYLVGGMQTPNQTQTHAPNMGQTQTHETQGKTPDFTHDVQLIKKLVEGKIIRICYDGVRYHVWTDTGSKRWYMYYRFRIFSNDVKMQVMQVEHLDENILIEPTDNPSVQYIIL